MKELVTISENKAIPSAYALAIPEFKDLSAKELSFVYFYADHRSPYAPYDVEERYIKLQDDLKIKKSVKLDKAIQKYNQLSETSAVKLLKSARQAVTKLEKYFRTVDLTEIDENGKLIYSAKDLVANLSNMGKVVSGLDELEDIVKKQQQQESSNRGGVITNKYSH